jgi:hypothetical protein
MKEPPRRRITLTSFLKGISTEIGWWRGGEALLRLPLYTSFYSRLLDKFLKTTRMVFPLLRIFASCCMPSAYCEKKIANNDTLCRLVERHYQILCQQTGLTFVKSIMFLKTTLDFIHF